MQQTYHELRITPASDYSLFLDVVLSLSDEAIEEDGMSIIVRSEDSLDMVAYGVELFAQELSSLKQAPINVDIALHVKENEDWIRSYREGVQPLHVGDFYVHPSWLEDVANKRNIIIDPALAFGSGHHETTYGCLMMLQRYVKAGDTLLDVGCGSGILGIAASQLGACVDACDTDEQATASAQSNFILNKTQYRTLWTGSVQQRSQCYDVVVANIIADVLMMLCVDLQAALKPNGILMLSGILGKYVNKVQAKFSSMQLLEHYEKEEWHTLVLQRNK